MARAFALLLTCAVALAACGGGGGLSEDEYRSEANAACGTFQTAVRDFTQPDDVAAIPAYAERAQGLLKVVVEKLRGLDAPSDLSANHDELTELSDQSVAALGALADAAKAGQQAEIQAALERASAIDDRTNEVARALGVDACADEN
ncbi:MAG: hypothetical protein JHC95_15570 [Solirubrobacteraceae bacterium]|nr:hypothetical protein [Solirubrobacteraceae bacterium]